MFRPSPFPATLATALLFFVPQLRCFASEVPAITTDRPDQTESSLVLPPGYVQLEMGWTHVDDDEDAENLESDSLPETLLRYGLTSRLELRLAHPGYIWEETQFADGSAAERLEGWGDSEIGLKYQLWLEEEEILLPEAAFLTHLSVPSGSRDFTSDRMDPSFRFLFTHTITESLSLAYNLGAGWSTEEDSRGEHDTLSVFQYTVSLGRGSTDKWGMFVELFGDIPMSADAKLQNYADGGVTYLIAENFQIDFSIGFGLSEAADDFFIGIGASYRWPD